jgi:potassium-dependent mechanosensitive channel
VLTIVNGCVLLVSLGCLLLGYVALGSLLVKQVVWILIVGHSAYLLAVFIDDACTAWIGAPTEASDDSPANATPALRQQLAVLLSAACRVVIVVVALALMAGPLGQGPTELMQRTDRLREGIAIGEMRLLPGAVLQALVVLALGLVAVRAAKKWLLDRYLPTTTLDAGMSISTATLLGYVGIVFVIALSLAALGLGLERVAWVASALSVGIGFGLQAVVQNFVSGLILLTERPVKVGDWVALGGVEGDIRRINVRATEIQMSDRSTLIVPNSEFITKVVRNVTRSAWW